MEIGNIWQGWQIEKEIGHGSYGTVYRCVFDDNGNKKYSAVKIISVPRDDIEDSSLRSEGMTNDQVKTYYKSIVDDFLNEIKLLETLKGAKNIVAIEESAVVEKEDGVGWQIFIRMELLNDFGTYASDKIFTQQDVLKLGLDLCEALKICGEKKIIHRDIKPENIFVDDMGNYKLGDFGVAKQLERTEASMSRKGTYNYMAPEVLSAKKYDSRADIYSLGIVMYRLLNNNRLPFIDPDKQMVQYKERQEAFDRRMRGEKVPPIKGVSEAVNEVILKACAFKAEDRYKTVEEFSEAINYALTGKKKFRIKNPKWVAAIASILVVSILVGTFATRGKLWGKPADAAVEEKETIEEVTTNASSPVSLSFEEAYLFPSDTQLLTDEYLETKTEDEIDLIMNEIYARHGYIFANEKFSKYFQTKSWYKPTEPKMENAYNAMNDIEQKNVQRIDSFRDSHFKKAEETTTEKAVLWQQLYKDHLKEVLKEYGSDRYFFDLIYIDNDRTPELAYGIPAGLGSQCTVLTVQNNKLVTLGQFGNYGDFQYVKYEGLIVEELERMGHYSIKVTKIENAKAVLVWEGVKSDLQEVEFEGENVYAKFESNGREVTKEEYDEEYHSIVGYDNLLRYRGVFELTEKNIEEHI